jgi:SAM-dependent methyltransferase
MRDDDREDAPMTDPRQNSPAAARNREPIVAILRDTLPAAGLVLEIASGTGEHVVHFARSLPHLDWQPSDPNPAARASIAAHVADEGLANIRAPIALDAASAAWPIDRADAILCINMVHISPWESTLGLMRGAAAILPPGGLLYLYGPYRRAGIETAPSNAAFDLDLQRRDPRWGLRELETVVEVAAAEGLMLERVIAMPANNLSVLLRA